jgi:hypothetical protein
MLKYDSPMDGASCGSDQGVYIIRWDFNDYFMFHRVQLAPCRGRWCWKLAKFKLGSRTYWSCYMAVYSYSLVVHKIIRYLALLLHYFLSFNTYKNKTENLFSPYPRSVSDINWYTWLKIAMSCYLQGKLAINCRPTAIRKLAILPAYGRLLIL